MECYSLETGGAKELWKLMSKEEQQGATVRAIDKMKVDLSAVDPESSDTLKLASAESVTRTTSSEQSTATPAAGTEQSTTAPTTIAEQSTTATTTIAEQSTTAPTTIAEQSTTAPTSIAEQSTTAPTSIAEQSTTAPTTIAEQSTTAPTTIAEQSTTAPATNNEGSTTGITLQPADVETTDSEFPATGPSVMQCVKAFSAYSKEELQRMLENKGGKVLGSTNLIYFIDTGGQAVYHDVHPVLITSPSVYLVVFSLKDFYQRTKKQQQEYFMADLIQRPLRSIHTFAREITLKEDTLCNEGFPRVPKIFVVGTHWDAVPHDVRDTFLDDLHKTIAGEIGKRPYRHFVQYDPKGRSFWAVDNTQAGKKQDEKTVKYISTLQERIRDRSMEIVVNVPFTWMLLKQVMSSKGVHYCTYQKLLNEARIRGYIRQASDLDIMLTKFHMLGLIYHKVPSDYAKEDSLVFIDPDCLYSTTSDFLMAAKEEILHNQQGGAEEEIFHSHQGGAATHVLEPGMVENQQQRSQLLSGIQTQGKLEGCALQSQAGRAGVVKKGKVFQRMEVNAMRKWHEIDLLLQDVESIMATIDQQSTEEVMAELSHYNQIAMEKDQMSVTHADQNVTTLKAKRDVYVTLLRGSLIRSMRTVLEQSLNETGATLVMEKVKQVTNDVWCQCRRIRRSIRGTDMTQFLSLLSKLRIIAQLEQPGNYVVPAAMPKPYPSNATRPDTNPVLVTIVSQGVLQACYLPSGMFCSLISELVTTLKWNIIPLERDHMAFTHNTIDGTLHVIEQDSYIEIYLESKAIPTVLLESYKYVKEKVQQKLEHVYKIFYASMDTITWGFQCAAHPHKTKHFAAFREDEYEHWSECMLDESTAVQPVTEEQLMWFPDHMT